VQRTEDDVIGTGTAISFLEAMSRAQPWAKDAACKGLDAPHFLVEPGGAREIASTVVACFEICGICPVKAECLRDALSARFTAIGCWGGSVMTERRALAPRLPETDRFKAPNADELDRIEEAAQTLERSFDKRLRAWRRLAAETSAKPAA